MKESKKNTDQLNAVRNKYGKNYSSEKLNLLKALNIEQLKDSKGLHSLHSTLLFLLAYPDNKVIYKLAFQTLKKLQNLLAANEKIRTTVYNSGITQTNLCASFSFEIVKWMRKNFPDDIRLSDTEANDGQISSILSVVMPKVESEILQDGNSDWKTWLMHSSANEEELLDRIIAVFDQTNIRPEVKDELWAALGLNVEILFSKHNCLPASVVDLFYHRSLISKKEILLQPFVKPKRIHLNKSEAEQVVAVSRIILMQQLREIDPITFTAAELVSYYQLDRGLSIALMSMVTERRHPIDSYIGYVAFKNGLPVAYAGSWILFDSARIGLNVFPEYRGGESAWVFQQVLNLHRQVYKLNRFTVDPYQLGKDNADGIQSGAFWIYYKAGFRPLNTLLKQIAQAEMDKIKTNPAYRTAANILKKLAESRMELVLNKKSVGFDATDCSRVYAEIVSKQFAGNRKTAELFSMRKMISRLQIKNFNEAQIHYVATNWAVLLFNKKTELQMHSGIKKKLKNILELKANGSEENYIIALQKFEELKKYMKLLTENT
ncbi:MAG: hypothetical protein WBP16_14705 [Ferruginibacter sp.]